VSTVEPVTSEACAAAEKQLQAYTDRVLTTDEVTLIEAHLEVCARCRNCYQLETVVWEKVKMACSEPCPETLKTRLRNLCAECDCD
jgi:anti-sigma factor (TIGR02949 family)